MRRLLLTIVLLLCVAAGALAVDIGLFLTSPLSHGSTSTIIIKPGTGFGAIVEQLADQGIIATRRQQLYFSAYARIRNMAHKIQSGEYQVDPAQTPPELLARLTSGDTIRYRITLVEGWTFAQMRAALEAQEELDHILAAGSDADIMAALGHPEQKAEGHFMPDTYFFARGATDLSIYQRSYAAMHDFLQQAWAERANDVAVKSPYEALILASIIEKETAVSSEMPRIAGVFTRRLQKGMLLQTDPTVIYGMEDYDGRITSKALRTDTPYNTYTRPGLPPTPIAMPSRRAIKAALHPQEGDALYFVSRNDGTHEFSATLAEHNRAVRKYQLGQSQP